MDRNSAIGLTLIALLLLVYFYWFSPKPVPPTQPSPAATTERSTPDSVSAPQAITTEDTLLNQQLGTAAQGKAENIELKNEDLRLTFNTHGGIIQEAELLHYQTYDQQPLKLITAVTDEFKLLTSIDGKPVNIYDLYYTSNQVQKGDSVQLTFSATLEGGRGIQHIYTLAPRGYELKYDIRTTNMSGLLQGETLNLAWTNIVPLMEKDLADTRINTTITYYEKENGFDELAPRSTDIETETLSSDLQWVATKEKFFLESLISNSFRGGEVKTEVNESDPQIVKRAYLNLLLSKEQLVTNQVSLKWYIGPNDYQVIGNVAEKFSKNVYLGWPPVYWINKFIIFPVFHFLTKFISNYGLIIVILVILLKLVLFPLSYRSYLSMAKMKVLKPELDEIKERVGDDMTKVQQEQLKLYQQVGVNPLSGCVPVLLQMPILFAMFYLFPASIELRQQPFLWAEDLSTYDSIVRLPFAIPYLGQHISLFTVLMTASTLIYTWQNNQISSVTGPMKSMSYIMPLIFFFVLNSFSAGLTFYYLVSNLVTFAQQAIIKRFVDEDKIKAIMEENRKKNAASGGKKSKFMNRLEDAMKASEEARRRAEEERKKRKK